MGYVYCDHCNAPREFTESGRCKGCGLAKGETPAVAPHPLRTFDGGAVRDNLDGKLNYRGFLDWGVIQEFGRYMERHRHLPNGGLRDWDNWKQGMPRQVYVESLARHALDVLLLFNGEGEPTATSTEEALGGVLFNAMGLWREIRLERDLGKEEG